MLIADDLEKLLKILPNFIRQALKKYDNNKLLEVVMDLGRKPEARYLDRPLCLSSKTISWQDLDHCIKRIGIFGGDNRSGIEKTLHRISSIRNRKGNIIGLTCRVGRALFGTIGIVRDLLEKQHSILILGKPGIGKTTAIREIARILADEMQKRVIVIDTSNEIAGDGDIPHPAIGRARRMQVALPELQHQVMIEAVENHTPQVIVIDEISTELEVVAARTIAERGVQLIGTVHGNFLNNLIKNPTLCDLVGGIEYVTLGDEEAKRRGTQKSILERKATPSFQAAIEVHERFSWVIHEKLDITVDQILQGFYNNVQCRQVLSNGKLAIYSKNIFLENLSKSQLKVKHSKILHSTIVKETSLSFSSLKQKSPSSKIFDQTENLSLLYKSKVFMNLYACSVSASNINKAIKFLKLPFILCQDIDKADIILTLKQNLNRNIQIRQVAKLRHIMIYVIQRNTYTQVIHGLRRIFQHKIKDMINWTEILKNKTYIEAEALKETKAAIENVVIKKKQPVQLLPRSEIIRKIQQKMIHMYRLKVRTIGSPSCRSLRIYLI